MRSLGDLGRTVLGQPPELIAVEVLKRKRVLPQYILRTHFGVQLQPRRLKELVQGRVVA